MLLVNGQTTGVDEKLQLAEAALQGAAADDRTRNMIGQLAAARATLALTRYQAETMLAQSRRALEYLSPTNLSLRANAHYRRFANRAPFRWLRAARARLGRYAGRGR